MACFLAKTHRPVAAPDEPSRPARCLFWPITKPSRGPGDFGSGWTVRPGFAPHVMLSGYLGPAVHAVPFSDPQDLGSGPAACPCFDPHGDLAIKLLWPWFRMNASMTSWPYSDPSDEIHPVGFQRSWPRHSDRREDLSRVRPTAILPRFLHDVGRPEHERSCLLP